MGIWISPRVYASCTIDSSVLKTRTGTPWGPHSGPSDKLILVAERWATGGAASTGWWAPPTIGSLAVNTTTAARRFGVMGGIFLATPYGDANSELPFWRHRLRGNGVQNQPIGRVVIGYADGHVALKSNTDLADPVKGTTTLDSWWSPMDGK